MPFMLGKEPIRRTINYLRSGKLVFKDSIEIVTFNYNSHGDHHDGIRKFLFWHLPQILYKNPDVQVLTIKNRTPTPFITFYYGNGKEMLVDVDMKNQDEIMSHLLKITGKSLETLKKESIAKKKIDNPANFGYGCKKSCICTIPGQLPCPAVVPLPYHLRGKHQMAKD